MSFKFTALALDHGPNDPLEKLVLLTLCDRADENGVCFPSRADIMARTKVSAATVSRKLQMLQAQGWIQRRQRFNSSTVFRVNTQRLERLEVEATLAKVAHIPEGFEPFEDEIANPQPIENKGDAHCEHTDAHSEHTDAHCDTPNLSLNRSSNLRRRKSSPQKGAKPSAATKKATASTPLMGAKAFALYLQHARPQETRAEFTERLSASEVTA